MTGRALTALAVATLACSEERPALARPPEVLDGRAPEEAGPVPGAVHVDRVDGRAIDERGAPVAGETLVTACGPAQCNPAFTDANGNFGIEVGFSLVPGAWSVQVHLRPDFAAFYFALPEEVTTPVVDMGELRTLDLPASGAPFAVDRAGAPAQTVTNGDVTVDVPGGAYVRVDVESNLAGGLGRELRTRRVPEALLAEFADPVLGLVALYAMEPFESSFELVGDAQYPTDVRVTLANAVGLAPGSAIDFLALGSYVFPEWLTPAALVPVAKGTVSSDGARVEMDPGEGVRHLTWLGIRPSR